MNATPRHHPDASLSPLNRTELRSGLRQLAMIMTLIAGCLAFVSCTGGTINQAPPAGMAWLDVTPDAEYRDRIDGIGIIAVNGHQAGGHKQVLRPGHNRVRVGFNWPQGGKAKVDLDFQTRPDTIYAIYYDTYPPYVDRLSESGVLDATAGEFIVAGAQMQEAGILMLPVVAAFGTAAVATRIGNEVAEGSRAAQYVDVRVVAQRCSQGVACTRRIYPDGRVGKR